MASAESSPQVTTHDKSVLWYTPELQNIETPAREIFENYCKIPSDQVTSHILQVRERAWDVWPYPCIGRFNFLDLSLSQSPLYPQILQRVKAGQTLLDLGCCFAQDIRKLVFDGAPSENTWGADLCADFIDLGYDLFLDRETLKTKFLTANIMDPQSALKQLDGQIDIVYAGSFFHLFGWDDQVKVAKRVVQLLKPRNGSLVLGRQVGNVRAGEYPRTSAKGLMWRHDGASLARMWKEVGLATGTKWNVDATLHEVTGFGGLKSGKEWHDENTRMLRFEVQRVN
ncbi:S-adenosyl-L-methionine-dependent methyltransferase-like [Lasallia pustulata]|uniref:S-adenosyl-L-methionine-dependent methyltransferase-like n=1 Tax=Lasallia pustulata TaxID=136370 RepID=A0A1W5CZD0_9LECA|nr:S-adenosyl-L-methionine-dependent methyltransferase-like [Lasallia pustulata]